MQSVRHKEIYPRDKIYKPLCSPPSSAAHDIVGIAMKEKRKDTLTAVFFVELIISDHALNVNLPQKRAYNNKSNGLFNKRSKPMEPLIRSTAASPRTTRPPSSLQARGEEPLIHVVDSLVWC